MTDASKDILKILLARYNLTMENTEYDTLALRNRDVVETFSPLANLGQDKKEENKENKEFDELELRNRTVVETLSPPPPATWPPCSQSNFSFWTRLISRVSTRPWPMCHRHCWTATCRHSLPSCPSCYESQW